MGENLKNKLIIILVLLTCIFVAISFDSCNNFRKQKLSREKEMSIRLDLEEKIDKLFVLKNNIERKLESAVKSLEQEKAAHEADKKVLLQEQLINQSLKEELQKVIKLKDALEEDLKEALVISKPKTEAVK